MSSIPAMIEEPKTSLPRETGYRVEVDRVTSTEWHAMLDQFQDANLYQSWAYGAVRWGRKNLSHLVVKKNGTIVAMSQLRIVRPTRFKFGIAYLRWGPIWTLKGQQPDPNTESYMVQALHQEYVIKRGLLLRVLPNAFAGTERAGYFQRAFSQFRSNAGASNEPYRTIRLDLSPSIEDLRKNLDKKWRNALSRAEKNELEIVQGNGIEEYRVFCRMYGEMLQRKGFDTTISIEEFATIQQELPANHRMQTLICMQGSVPVAGIVCSAMGDSAIYLLGATSDSGLTAKGAYLLQWTWIAQLKEAGFSFYDLGGIDPKGNPGVYHFKCGFSGMDSSHISPITISDGGLGSRMILLSEIAQRGVVALKRKLRSVKSA